MGRVEHRCRDCRVKLSRPESKRCRDCENIQRRLNGAYNKLGPEDFWSRVDKGYGCWIYSGPSLGDGYGAFGGTSAHRYSYTLHYGPIPDGLEILHHCDVKRCVRPDHLFKGTQNDNMQDAKQKGRTCSGDKNGSRTHIERMQRGVDRHNAKLNPDAVRLIREKHRNGVSIHCLAREFGVHLQTASCVVNGRTWKHVA